MNLFYMSFIIIAAYSFDLRKRYSKDASKLFLFFIYIILLFNIIMLQTLPDLKNYQTIYEKYMYEGKIDNHVEIGYMLFNRIFADLSFPFHVFRCVLIIFSCALFFNGIIELSECLSISALYFYTCIFVYSYLIQIRTGLGLSVFVGIGLPAYYRKKNHILILSILIAMTFHLSMIALVCPFLLCKLPKTHRIKIFFTILVIGLLFINVFDLFNSIVKTFFGQTKLIAYINESGARNNGLSTRDIVNFIFCIIFSCYTNENEFDNLMFWSFFCGYVFKILFRNFFEIGVRFNLLFSYSLIFLMPLLYKQKPKYTIYFIYAFAFVNFKQWLAAGNIIKNGNF